ncbi:MAG: YraN family protein [Phaeodactylibacter sp.]|nr:YraN family protein [Phaeodactylibacter sp.]
MAKHNEVGKRGEEIAAQFFQEQGFTLLARNWRYRQAEIDLIAKDSLGELVFIEVRTRSSGRFGPAGSLSGKKMRLLADAANAYLESIGHSWTYRFDLIGIILVKNGPPLIEHYPDAFFPGS